jgi:hypothetical protein
VTEKKALAVVHVDNDHYRVGYVNAEHLHSTNRNKQLNTVRPLLHFYRDQEYRVYAAAYARAREMEAEC